MLVSKEGKVKSHTQISSFDSPPRQFGIITVDHHLYGTNAGEP